MITADFGYGFISYIGNFLLHNRLNVGFFMSRFILPEVVYTALVSLIIYHPVHYVCVLTGQERERKKKGKIDEGSVTTKGLNHLIYEIVDNSVDEHLAGACDTIISFST